MNNGSCLSRRSSYPLQSLRTKTIFKMAKSWPTIRSRSRSAVLPLWSKFCFGGQRCSTMRDTIDSTKYGMLSMPAVPLIFLRRPVLGIVFCSSPVGWDGLELQNSAYNEALILTRILTLDSTLCNWCVVIDVHCSAVTCFFSSRSVELSFLDMFIGCRAQSSFMRPSTIRRSSWQRRRSRNRQFSCRRWNAVRSLALCCSLGVARNGQAAFEASCQRQRCGFEGTSPASYGMHS